MTEGRRNRPGPARREREARRSGAAPELPRPLIERARRARADLLTLTAQLDLAAEDVQQAEAGLSRADCVALVVRLTAIAEGVSEASDRLA